MNIQRLSNRVLAKNLAAVARNVNLGALTKLAKQFAGQKILLASRTNFTAKFRKAVEALKLPNGVGVQSWVSTSAGHSVCANFKTCVTAGGHTCYGESYFFLGSITNGVLTPDANEGIPWRANYSVDEILKAREDVKTARAAMQAAESRLQGFGEGDN